MGFEMIGDVRHYSSNDLDNLVSLFNLGMARDVPAPLKMPEGLHLNLGAGKKQVFGALPLDLPEWDADTQPIPYADESVAGVHAYHFLEHVANPVNLLKEIERVTIPGAVINIVVPYYNSQIQATDLFHRSAFCEETWKNLFDNPFYSRTSDGWKLKEHLSFIIGIKERNLALLTQLVRTK